MTLARERRTLFIVSEVRSGSTYVAETLAYELNDALGYDLWQLLQEPFQELNERSTPQHALSILERLHLDRSGFAGAKVLCKHMAILLRLATACPALRNALLGPDAYWIVVRRADRVEQAVSLAAARKSGVYHFYDDPQTAADRDVSLEMDEIQSALAAIALSDLYLELLTTQLPANRTLSLKYEDLLIDQVGALQCIHDLCGFPPLDAGRYLNGAKIRPTAQETKRRASAEYKDWLLANYN